MMVAQKALSFKNKLSELKIVGCAWDGLGRGLSWRGRRCHPDRVGKVAGCATGVIRAMHPPWGHCLLNRHLLLDWYLLQTINGILHRFPDILVLQNRQFLLKIREAIGIAVGTQSFGGSLAYHSGWVDG